MKIFTKILLIVYLSMLSWGASAAPFPLSEYNLVTIGKFKTNSEVEGATFVGGNLVDGNSQNYGIHLNSPYVIPTLTVAGKVKSGNPLSVRGPMVVSSQNSIWQNANQFKVNGRWVNNTTGITVDPDLASKKMAIKTQLEDASAAFAGMVKNSTVSSPSGCCGPYKLNVNPTLGSGDYAVFDKMQWGIFGNNNVQQIEVVASNLNTIDGVIINVGGTTVDWSSTSSNMVGNALTSILGRKKILWNFYEATTINLGAKSFMGALLAPYATVTAANPIEGSVGVFSLLTTSEVHLPLTTVGPPGPTVEVPEPSTVWLFVLSSLAVVLRNRTRR